MIDIQSRTSPINGYKSIIYIRPGGVASKLDCTINKSSTESQSFEINSLC